MKRRLARPRRRLLAVLAVSLVVALLPAGPAQADEPAVAFSDVPDAHGGNSFYLTVAYSVDDHPTSYRRVPDEVTVTNARLGGVRRLARTGPDRNKAWVLTVVPAGADDVVVEVRGVSVTVTHAAGAPHQIIHSGSLFFERFVLRMDENTEERFAWTFTHPGSDWESCTTTDEHDTSHNIDAEPDVSVSYTDTHIVIDSGIDTDSDQETGTYTMTVTCTSAGDATVQIDMSASISYAVTDTVSGSEAETLIQDAQQAPELQQDLSIGGRGGALALGGGAPLTTEPPRTEPPAAVPPSGSVSFDDDSLNIDEGAADSVGYTLTEPGDGWSCTAAAAAAGDGGVTAAVDTDNAEADIAAAHDTDTSDGTATVTLTVTCTKDGEDDYVISDSMRVFVIDDDVPPCTPSVNPARSSVSLTEGRSATLVGFDVQFCNDSFDNDVSVSSSDRNAATAHFTVLWHGKGTVFGTLQIGPRDDADSRDETVTVTLTAGSVDEPITVTVTDDD